MTRLATHANIHNATTVQACSKTGVPGGIKFTFCTDDWNDGYAEYCVFLDDQVLANRLATAVNEITKARKDELVAVEVEPVVPPPQLLPRSSPALGMPMPQGRRWRALTAREGIGRCEAQDTP